MKSILIKPYQHSRSVSLFLCGTLVEALPFYSSSLNVLLRVIRLRIENKSKQKLSWVLCRINSLLTVSSLEHLTLHALSKVFFKSYFFKIYFLLCQEKRWEAARLSKLALVKKEKGKIVMPAFFKHTTKKSTCPHQNLFIYLKLWHYLLASSSVTVLGSYTPGRSC